MTEKVESGKAVIDWTDEAAVSAAMLPGLDGVRPEFGAEQHPEPDAKPAEQAVEAKAPDAEPKAEPKAETPKPEEIPTGVLAKDGKTVIPYEVLAETRRRATAAEAQLAEINRLVEEAEAGGGEVTLPNLAELEGKFPEELINPLKAMYARVGKLEQNNRSLTEQLTAKQQEELAQQQEQQYVAYSQDLSETPLLQKLEQIKGPLYEQAKSISDSLLADKTHYDSVTQNGKADISAARKAHNKAVEAQLRGLLGMPAHVVTPPAKTETKPAVPKALPTLEAPAPESISEIPGGHAPAATEGEGFMNMDAGKSVAFLSKMSPKQQDEWLARSFR